MSWSYSGDPTDSTRDKVRFLIGDTDAADQQLSDEEIDSALTDSADEPYAAAIACTSALVSKYTRKSDKRMGDLYIFYSQIAKGYKDLVSQLRRAFAIKLAAPYAGGISVSDKDSTADDSDRVPPAFTTNLHSWNDPLHDDGDRFGED